MGLDIPDLVRYLNDPNVKGKLRKMMQQEVLSKKAAQVKEFASWIDDVHAKLRGKAFLSEADFESIVNDLEKAYNAGIIDRNQFVGYTREFQSALRETPLPEPTAKTAKIYDVDDPIYKSKEGKEWAGIFDPTATASRYGKEISEAKFLDIVNALQKAREGGFITSSYAAKLTRYWQQRTRFPKKLKPGEKLDPFGRKVEAADPSKKPPEVDMEAWGGDLEEWQLSKQTSKKEWKKAQYKYDNPKTGSYITQLTIGGAALAGYGIYKGGEQIKKFITNLLLNYMNSTIGMGEVNWVIDPEDKSVPDQPRQKKQESYPGDQSFERLMRRAQVSAAQLSPSVSAIQRREDDSEDDEDYSEAILEAAFMSIGRLGISSAKSTQDSISALRLARISSAKLSNEARASLNRQSRLASTEARRGAREHDRVVNTVARERRKVETTQRQAGRYLGVRAGRLLFEVLDGQKEPFAKAWQLCGQAFVSTVVESIYGTFEDAALDWLDRITGLSKVLEKIAKALEKFMAQVLGNDDDSGGIEDFGGSVPAHRGMAPQVRPSSSSPSSLARRIDFDGSGPIVVQVVLPEHLCLDHQALAQNLAFSMQRYAHRWN